MQYDVQTTDVPEQTVANDRRKIGLDELQRFVGEAVAKMRDTAQRAGVPEAGPPFAIFHEKVGPDADGDVEVCLPLDVPPDEPGVVEARRLPETHAAYVDVPSERVAYPALIEAYDAVADYILRAGRLLGDAPREIYMDGRTRILWPVGAEAHGEHAQISP